MNKITKTIKERSESFDRKVSKINYRDYGIDWEDIKSHISQTITAILESVREVAMEMHRNSEMRSSELETSQGGYEYGLEDVLSTIDEALKESKEVK